MITYDDYEQEMARLVADNKALRNRYKELEAENTRLTEAVKNWQSRFDQEARRAEFFDSATGRTFDAFEYVAKQAEAYRARIRSLRAQRRELSTDLTEELNSDMMWAPNDICQRYDVLWRKANPPKPVVPSDDLIDWETGSLKLRRTNTDAAPDAHLEAQYEDHFEMDCGA